VAERTRIGKRRELAFSKEGFELWNAVLPFLSSPVRKRIYVQTQGEIFANLPESGETALARYSSIDFPRHAVYALKVGSSDAEEFLLHCVDDQDIEQEYAEIELWAYDPHLLSRGETVDMLSLFLTLRASTDERIQKALSEMMESIKW